MKLKILFIGLLLLFSFFFIERIFIPETTNEIIERAYQYGRDNEKKTPDKTFHFDGCTLFFDRFLGSSFKEACLNHDIAYWYGGTGQERLMVDVVFRGDIAETGLSGKVLSPVMYLGVRLFGDSFIAKLFNANWGFGYN